MRRRHHDGIGFAAGRRRDHHDPLDPRDLGRQDVHQHRRRIGRAAAGDIDARGIDRTPARAEPGAGGIAIIAVLGQLRGVIGPDTRRREVERAPQFGCQRRIGRSAILGGDTPAAAVEVEAIEARGIIGQRRVAFGLHPRDDRRDIGGHVRRALAPVVDQRVERGGKAGVGGVKPPHRGRPRGISRPARAPRPNAA